MRIQEFAEKYGVSKRSVDYWTNIGVLHTEDREPNKYRNYGEKAEEEIKEILVLEAMNLPVNSETIRFLRAIPRNQVRKLVLNEIDKQKAKMIEKFDTAWEYAVEIQRRKE